MSSEHVLWVNGRLVPINEPCLDPRDRGFTLGDGMFETVRARRGLLPALPRHLARLRHGAATIGLSLPWTDVVLTGAMHDILVANDLKDAVVRLTVSRGVPSDRGLLPDPEAQPSLVVHGQPFTGYHAALYARGMRAITSTIRRNEQSPLANVKALSALDSVLARRDATAADADEALLCNTIGNLACASAANIFLVTDDALITPDTASGALPGTMRDLVLSEFAPHLGLAAVARPVQIGELATADEAFLTSALLGVMPLSSIDNRPVGTGRPGPTATRLAIELETWWTIYIGANAT